MSGRGKDHPLPQAGGVRGGRERSEHQGVRWPTPLRLGSKLPSLAAPPACGRGYNLRPINSFMLSFVPPKMRVTRAPRHMRAIGYSFI